MIDLSNAVHYVLRGFRFLHKTIPNRFIILTSGRASGKSNAMAQKIVLDTFDSTQKGNWLVLQSTYSAMRDSSFADIVKWIDLWNLEQFFEISRATLGIKNLITNRRIIFRGVDNGMKIKSISGVSKAWFEEANLIPEKDFWTVSRSIRGFGKEERIYITFNPDTPYTYLKDMIDNPVDYDVFHHHSYYYDNPKNGKEFVDDMERLKKRNYTRYLNEGLGEFTVTEGVIIDNDKIEDYIDGKIYGNNPFDCYGMDWGFTDDTIIIHSTYYSDTETLVIHNIIKTNNKTPSEVVALIPIEYKNKRNCWGDQSAPFILRELNQNGFKFIGANKKSYKMNTFINFLDSLDRIVLNPKAEYFKNEASKWAYKENSDVPKDGNDHSIDALKYSLCTILSAKEQTNNKLKSYRGK